MSSQRVLFLTSEGSVLGHKVADRHCWDPVYYFSKVYDADIAVSVGYRHILTKDQLALFPRGVVNLHTGYLPWNRGAYPNVWPLIDGSPAGVTLHWMDEGVDTGPIIAQERVTVDPWDTAGSLYEKLNDAAFELFKLWWPKILDGTAPSTPQVTRQGGPKVYETVGSTHKKSDLAGLDGHHLETGWTTVHEATPDELFNQLRARTFPGQPGLKLCVDGQWVEATINLKPCGDPNEGA